MKIKGNLDFNQNELRKAVIERLSSAPSSPVLGQMYFNINDNLLYVFNGVDWISLNNPPTSFTQNIIVSASGTDNYIGSATPNISNYDPNSIYITTFENANTITNPTINIDGVGVLNIVKSDITGIVPLAIGDIQPATTYFLVWDGNTNIQLFTSSPASSPGTYTNLNPVPITIGGIQAGTTFNNVPFDQVFTNLLYPYLIPQFNSFGIVGQNTTLEVGDSISSGNKTFSWTTTNSSNIAPNTIQIIDITEGNIILANNIANDGNEIINFTSAITKTTPSTHTWQIRATRTNNSIMTRNFNVNWKYRYYYGTNTNPTLTQTQIEALENSFLGDTIIGTYNLNTGGYKYFVMPSTSTEPTLFRDASTNLAVAMADSSDGYTNVGSGPYSFQSITITNQFGISQQYNIYRTKYILGGNIQIIVT